MFGAATFLFWAALYLYVPILPEYAESKGAGLSMVGAVIASYAIAQLLLRIPLGISADILGKRKPFVVAGLLIATLGALGMAMAPGPWLLFAARAITGVSATTWVISSVLFVSFFPAEKSARGIGIISFVNSVAMVTATFSGGLMAEAWGSESVFYIGAALGVLGALLLIPVAEPSVERGRSYTLGDLKKVLTHPVLLTASFLSLFVHFADFATGFSFTLVYAEEIGASSDDLGLITAIFLGSASLANLGSVYMIERWGYQKTIVLGACIFGTALVAIPHISDLGQLEGLQVISGVGRGLVYTSLMALSISAVPLAHRATSMGVFQAVYALGMLTGPIVGGVMADGLGISSVFYLSGSVVILTGALSLVSNPARR